MATVKREKAERNRRCQAKFGPDYHYDPSIDVYAYPTEYALAAAVPFDFADCTHVDMQPRPDAKRRYFTGVQTEAHCKALKGVWRAKATSRENGIDDGVCWTNARDAACTEPIDAGLRPLLAAKHNHKAAKPMAGQRVTAKQACVKNPKCVWLADEDDCMDKTTIEKNAVRDAEGRPFVLPRNWPVDITAPAANVARYLQAYYAAALDQRPPRHLDLIGKGDRCNTTTGGANVAATGAVRKGLWGMSTTPPSGVVAIRLVERPAPVGAGLFPKNFNRNLAPMAPVERLYVPEPVLDAPPPPKGAQRPLLSQHQTVVGVVMKGMARAGRRSTNRGLLCWHSVGSGKTNTAMGVVDAFWDTPKRIVFATSIEALANNPPSTFHALALTYYKRFAELADADPAAGPDASQTDRVDAVRRAFDARGVQFMTFAQLAHVTLVARPLKMRDDAERERHLHYLDDAVLIIDEVQGLFKPLPTQMAEHTALRTLLGERSAYATSMGPAHTRHLNLVILTATPGDSPQEICDLLNLVRDRRAPPIIPPAPENPASVAAFGDAVRGLISYFDVSSDTTRFPVVKQLKPQAVRLSLQQYKRYVEAFRAMSPEQADFDRLVAAEKVGDYMKPARKYANMMYDFEDHMSLFEFSAKLERLFASFEARPSQKHYVYSAFYEKRGQQSIVGVGSAMESEAGYVRLTVEEAAAIAADPETSATTLPAAFAKRKRYVIATTTELVHARNSRLSMGECLKRLLVVYNHPLNRRGEYVHVFLASQSFNEGIDLKATRHVHILDALLSSNKEIQTIGRAARFCSHKDLDRGKGEWSVAVHRYLAEYPLEIEVLDVDGAEFAADKERAALAAVEEERKGLAGQRGAEAKARREVLDGAIKAAKVRAREADKVAKERANLNPRAIRMVDAQIMEEVKLRTRTVALMHSVMRDASIDCLLFRDFHNQGRSPVEQIECMDA